CPPSCKPNAANRKRFAVLVLCGTARFAASREAPLARNKYLFLRGRWRGRFPEPGCLNIDCRDHIFFPLKRLGQRSKPKPITRRVGPRPQLLRDSRDARPRGGAL